MSGGSMGYLYSSVQDAYFRENTPERKALRLHLNKLAKALQAVEWNDSADGADNESELIREAIGDQIILEASIQAAKEAHKDLGDQLARAEGSWLSKEMQTPAKGFPALRTIEPGVSVIIRTKDTNQAMWDGVFGIVESKFAKSTGSDLDLWWVNIEDSPKGTGVVLSGKHLEVRG